MKKQILLAIFFLIMTFKSEAQQDPQFSHYMFNSLVINPAYAGYKKVLNLNGVYRSQWAGIDGAPETQSLVLDGAFAEDKVGLGLSIINDKAGLIGQLSANFNYAYKLNLTEENVLSLGLGVGFAQYSFNSDRAYYEDLNDPNISSEKISRFFPEAKFGVHYSDENLYVGLSITNLFSKTFNTLNSGNNPIATKGAHYFLTAGYLYELNDFLKFKPSFLLKEDTKGPTGLDLNAFFLLDEKIWIGTSFRSAINLWKKRNLNTNLAKTNAVVGMLQYVSKSWSIGYSYDYSVSKLSNYDHGSHELSVGLVIGREKKNISMLSPRYF